MAPPVLQDSLDYRESEVGQVMLVHKDRQGLLDQKVHSDLSEIWDRPDNKEIGDKREDQERLVQRVLRVVPAQMVNREGEDKWETEEKQDCQGIAVAEDQQASLDQWVLQDNLVHLAQGVREVKRAHRVQPGNEVLPDNQDGWDLVDHWARQVYLERWVHPVRKEPKVILVPKVNQDDKDHRAHQGLPDPSV